jgi:hypothetical protein
MRYLKYSKLVTFCLLSLTLSLIQCNKETSFTPYRCIKGQVTDGDKKVPIDSATVRLWINGLQSDTLTYYTDSQGVFSTERINNWFDKSLTIEASRNYSTNSNPDFYGSVYTNVSPDILNAKDTITSDTLYIPIELVTDNYNSLHTVLPKRLDFPFEGQYSSYFIILNEGSNLLYWEIGENNTEWMTFYWIRIYNAPDMNHLRRGGYVKFKVNISKQLAPGTYDSSILVITDQGNTIIPVHVTIE